MHCAQRWERRCRRSVRCNSIVVDDYAANVAPNAAVTTTRLAGGGGVGSGKNGVGGGSSTNRDNDDHDVDGDCRRQTVVAMMTSMSGKRGGRGDGEATAGRRRGNGDAKAIGYGASAGKLIESIGRNRPEGAMLLMDADPQNSTPSAGLLEGILKLTINFQTAFFPPGACSPKTFMTVP